MKTYSLNNVKDTLIGQPGTPRRDAYEAKLAEITAKLRPILFSTPMVQAILDGRKTHTRRVMKPQPIKNGLFWEWAGAGWSLDGPITPVYGHSMYNKCPYQPGDVLWVRETFAECQTPFFDYIYKADYPNASKADLDIEKWTPSLFMPKAAARIFLKVTAVKAERLQDITEADAIAEGVESWIEERMKSRPTYYSMYSDYDSPNDPAMYSSCPILSFESLWRKINGPESWNENPWVWAITFERCENPTQNPKLKTQN